ncbi:MAG: hypothetical protein A3B89_04995 [Candidatus Buchananbacteria bacterium RIFCSPHIGHO2_02_FULL_40_13]|uniref:Uncharacterized protein n=1 Tax=Candidatus Buchananbacteria bacterium RIFCSPLOWO2_01_FULL_39_33 TaxID=1797543 RepID=A0A1G1YGF2_9BACT|nr:MAG: hypothetical protein A2820_00325 [Candidatus Buchananbacteria bacterium RIFCSPHIGHO2_01_FULL_40_35]OGY49797.1 MAG: hypothetical protein A3B89_04995 [Candidatus Buchananbacteria bacterium RIFCSPHIGHO2_02_FULL_40_13]OGY51412.1 MAG: hypothetical protein A3A02_03500 [Candidatus Buchananbacteria bacterium RIFCSPLOWO2_01_FULL_39_33]
MNFLTIEKFRPQCRTGILKKLLLGLIILVVPMILSAAWALFDLNSNDLNQKSQTAESGNKPNKLTARAELKADH